MFNTYQLVLRILLAQHDPLIQDSSSSPKKSREDAGPREKNFLEITYELSRNVIVICFSYM